MTAAAIPPSASEALARVWGYYATDIYGTYAALYRELPGWWPETRTSSVWSWTRPHLLTIPTCCSLRSTTSCSAAWTTPSPILLRSRSPARGRPGIQGPVLHRRQELLEIMSTRRIQTNECGRTAVLAVGLSAAASRLGQPIALLDAGASAGLNLRLDRYLLDFGGFGRLGPEDSSVRVACGAQPDDRTVGGAASHRRPAGPGPLANRPRRPGRRPLAARMRLARYRPVGPYRCGHPLGRPLPGHGTQR